MFLQLPEMMRSRNLFLAVLAVLLIALGFVEFKVDKPVQPNGPAANEIMSTIDELALAAGARVDKTNCRMITKQYMVVICEIEHIKRMEATRKLGIR